MTTIPANDAGRLIAEQQRRWAAEEIDALLDQVDRLADEIRDLVREGGKVAERGVLADELYDQLGGIVLELKDRFPR